METEPLLSLLLFVQHEKLNISEPVEANMEAEADWTLDALAVVAKTPLVSSEWTHMDRAMLVALESKEFIILARRLSSALMNGLSMDMMPVSRMGS